MLSLFFQWDTGIMGLLFIGQHDFWVRPRINRLTHWIRVISSHNKIWWWHEHLFVSLRFVESLMCNHIHCINWMEAIQKLPHRKTWLNCVIYDVRGFQCLETSLAKRLGFTWNTLKQKSLCSGKRRLRLPHSTRSLSLSSPWRARRPNLWKPFVRLD